VATEPMLLGHEGVDALHEVVIVHVRPPVM
jgi:hypothetical protein